MRGREGDCGDLPSVESCEGRVARKLFRHINWRYFQPARRVRGKFSYRRRGRWVRQFVNHGLRDHDSPVKQRQYLDFADKNEIVQRRSIGYNDHCRRKLRLVSASRSMSAVVTGKNIE